jgi:hypothetical protein
MTQYPFASSPGRVGRQKDVSMAMAIDIYNYILEHADNNPRAAGDLHEKIWGALLHRSDPGFHNVRLTRGDGGIDGIVFTDPVNGEAKVYQAKFYKDLNKPDHKKAIVDSFITAHGHSFPCVEWVLLFPRLLSSEDLGWLMGDMKRELLIELKNDPDLKRKIDPCAISFQDAQDLGCLIFQHLDIAAKYLPDSALALAEQLKTEREARTVEQVEMHRLLRSLNEEAIRKHEIDTLRAKAALHVLIQGW